MPKVSIIVPIYNVEKYLPRCMDSLLNQTLEDIEIILVDDESPDGCPALCDTYSQQDSRIKIIHKKNEGLGFARNSGLKVATGEFVAFVDSDDYVKTTMFEELYNEAKKESCDAVFCNFNKVKANGEVIEITEVKNKQLFSGAEDIKMFLFDMIGAPPSYPKERKYSMSVWHAIYSFSLIQKYKISFPSERVMISEDIIYHIHFIPKTRNIVYLPTCNYYYCENETSLTKTYRKDRFKRYILLHKEMSKLLTHLFPSKLWRNSIDRCMLGYTRNDILKGEANKILSQKKLIDNIKEIVNDTYFRNILMRFPYKQLPLAKIFFMWLLRFKQYRLIYYLQKLVNILKK
jgi:glycosyltransferase involved in cell wall biosynthesis